VELPRAKGGVFRVGAVRLEVMGQTYPCCRMQEAHAGLLKALAVDWRGGVTCRVQSDGQIGLGDAVEMLVSPREVLARLPG
jgi:MOSC domain-containing protein YiiM